jgi:hypothetical protein
MDCPIGVGRDDAAEGGEERYNTQSTFETSKYNSCNIRQQLKHLKHASKTFEKKKHMKTIATSK